MTAISRHQSHPTSRHCHRRLLAGVAIVAAGLVAGCASEPRDSSGLLSPYRTDLPQGNYLTREMLDQIRPGMTREQVKAVLGAPLLRPVFRDDRWDYVFRYQKPNRDAEQRRVIVRFEGDRVTAIEADALPEREDPNDPALPGARVASGTKPAPKSAASPDAVSNKEKP